MRRQCADVARACAASSSAPRFRFVVVGRGLHVDGPFQIERELFGADDRRALRSRAEDQTLQPAFCARSPSFSPSKASTISARAAGSEGRSSGRIAMSENYTKALGFASKTRRFNRRSSAASSPSGPLATTPRDLRSASPIEAPSRASSPREQAARRSAVLKPFVTHQGKQTIPSLRRSLSA